MKNIKIFKNIKNGKLYTIIEVDKILTAIPLDSNEESIKNCSMNDFVPSVIGIK